MSGVPNRFIISVPTDVQEELSDTSSASKCYSQQKFSRKLQEYLTDYALTTSTTPLVLTDVARIKVGNLYEL